ncbi:MAG TPA: CDP-alcohol phosphatidyltransferase family protein [Allosphingosinicella sp.]|nr:CDP-alcohol phosphatidyltransferase family protein [Allosphingosinicella sp.]
MRVAFAWLVHLFTASGVVIAFLALEATWRGEWRLALVWLLAALAVDGVDGTLARWARVKENAPRIDGEAFDLIVDYLNYVFVPAIFIVRAGLVPEPLALPLAAAILLSSVYVFVRRDMKTPDNYFRGFPALWNVVALYLFAARPDPVAGAIVVAILAILSFAPIRFVHPFRVVDHQPWLRILALVWAVATLALLWPGWSPGVARLSLNLSYAAAALLLALSLVRTLRGDRAAAPDAAER